MWREGNHQHDENSCDSTTRNCTGRRQYKALGEKLLNQVLPCSAECESYRHLFLSHEGTRQQEARNVYAGNRQQQERCGPEQDNRWLVVSKYIVSQRCNNREFAGFGILRILVSQHPQYSEPGEFAVVT